MILDNETTLALLYQVYGLSFFVFGVVLYVLPKKGSSLTFAEHLGWLSAFGMLHGFLELVDEVQLFVAPNSLLYLSTVLLIVSFLSLFEFARRGANRLVSKIFVHPLFCYPIIILGIYIFYQLSGSSVAGLQAGARYFLGVPGALLSGVILLAEAKRGRSGGKSSSTASWMQVASASLFVYAFLTLFVAPVGASLSFLPTASDFFHSVGLPVQLFRSICALLLAIAFVIVIRRANEKSVSELIETRVVQENENRFKALFYRIQDAWVLLDSSKITDCNQAAVDLFGLSSKSEAMGQEFSVLSCRTQDSNGSADELFRCYCSKAVEEGSYLFEWDCQAADGRLFKAEILLSPVDFLNQTSILVIIRDITERVEFLQALKHERDYANNLIEIAPVIILLLDREGSILNVNPWFEKLSGYSVKEVVGKNWFSTFLPEVDRSKIEKVFDDSTHGKPTRGNINSIVTRDGKELDIEWYDQIISNTDGEFQALLVTGQDVTERNRAQEAIEESRERLNRAQEIAKVGSWELDLKTDELYWADQIYDLFELEKEKFVPSYDQFLKAIHPEDRDAVDKAYSNSLQTQRPYKIVHRLLMSDGRIKWVEERCDTDFNEQGEPLVSRGTIQDITELYRIQQELSASQARYRRAERGTNDGLWEWNIVTGYDYLSPRWFSMLGYSPEELPHHEDTFFNLLHADDKERVSQALDAHFAEGAPFDIEIRLQHKTGNYLWFRSRGVAEFDSEGNPTLMAGTIADITRRKHAEEEASRLASIVRNSPDFVGISDVEGHALFLNEAGRKLVGITDDEFFHTTRVTDYFAEQDQEYVASEILPIVLSEGRWAGEVPFRNFQTNELIPVWFDIFRIDDENRKPINFATISRDIRETKLVERELEQYRNHLEDLVEQRTSELNLAREKAENANAAKTEFLSRMSHELRTPLNAILGFSELLLNDSEHALSEDQADSVSEVKLAGGHLLRLVNEILDLSSVESGHLDMSLTTVSINQLLQSCISQCRPIAENRNISMQITLACGDCPVIADEFRLRQVFINLISNAIKYNYENGEVLLTCEMRQNSKVRVYVQDSGRGIPPEQQDAIFKPFERLVSAYEGIEGTGIGLALSTKLMHAMGGDLGVVSDGKSGSKFWVELPVCQEINC